MWFYFLIGMAKYRYYTQGTCSSQIDLDVDDNGVIQDVAFTGGCNGNLQGISRLVKGMSREEAIAKLAGIKCGNTQKSTPVKHEQSL